MTPHARLALLLLPLSCGATSGSAWMAQPLVQEEARAKPVPGDPTAPIEARAEAMRQVLSQEAAPAAAPATPAPGSTGRSLGTFRNTYYDFPSEADYKGPKASVMSASCTAIAEVPRAFHDAVCVQGSGRLKRGATISFARRDCECADVCPRTGHRICYDQLDAARFPWGRGAAGRPIAPLRTVAADTRVLPLGTVIHVPEFEGVMESDGCFVVEDRGTRVVGNHIDVFTGSERMTAALNGIVASNRGVTVIVDSPKCARPTLQPDLRSRTRADVPIEPRQRDEPAKPAAGVAKRASDARRTSSLSLDETRRAGLAGGLTLPRFGRSDLAIGEVSPTVKPR